VRTYSSPHISFVGDILRIGSVSVRSTWDTIGVLCRQAPQLVGEIFLDDKWCLRTEAALPEGCAQAQGCRQRRIPTVWVAKKLPRLQVAGIGTIWNRYTWAPGSPSGHTCRDAKTHQLDSLYIVSSSGHMSRNAKMHQKLQDANSVVDNVVHPQSKAHRKDDQLQPTVRKREDLRCGNFEIAQTCTSNI
jgi:hypothetical protein